MNDKSLLKKYGKYGIDFGKEHPIGTIVGASGLLIGLGRGRGMNGLCLMGETFGLPLITDPKAADALLHILVKILGVKVDMSRLEKTISEMEQRIASTDKIHKNMLEQLSEHKKSDDIKYIG